MHQADQTISPGGGGTSDAHAKAAEVAEQAQDKAQQAAGQMQDKLRGPDHRAHPTPLCVPHINS